MKVHKLFVFVFLFTLLAVLAAGSFFVFFVNQRMDFIDQSGAGVRKSLIGSTYLYWFFNSQKVWTKGLYDRRSGKFIQSKKIVYKLLLEKQEISLLSDTPNGILASYSLGATNTDEFVIQLHVNRAVSVRGKALYERLLNYAAVYTALKLTREQPLNEEEEKEVLDLVNNYLRKNGSTRWFLKFRSNNPFGIGNIWGLFRPKAVYAGWICTGKYSCSQLNPNQNNSCDRNLIYDRLDCTAYNGFCEPPVGACGNIGCTINDCSLQFVADPAPPPPAPPEPPSAPVSGCGQCAGCFPDTGGCPSDYPSNAGQGSCSSGNHACCQPACPGGGGGGETCLGQPKPSNCCNTWCRGEQNCYQQESGWWCEDAGWVCEGNANSWSACSPPCGNGQQTNECGGNRNCYTFCCDANLWGAWTSCSGSPATKSRVNQCGTSSGPVSCTGTINARAVKVNVGVNTCTTVRASTSGVNGTVHQFTAGSASQPAAQTQSGASYVTFSNVVGGSYTISPTTPLQDWVLTRACWSRTLNAPTSGEGLSAYLSVPTDGETLTWDLGYLDGTPWVQTGGGGNVYGAGTLRSSIPFGTSPRVFSLTGAGGSPGLVTYGTSYDFDSSPTLKGENYVSSKNWLASQTYSPVVNYYEYFRIKLGGPITPSTVQEMGSPQESMSKPPSRTIPYYVVGDMTTSGDWNIPNGETVIFIVNGNLTLGGKVNLTGSGFAAFIVNGNITVSSSVGGLYTSSTPVIEGIYITKATGTFQTGTSSVVGKERFVAKGMFMAGSFLLQRDLDSVNANTTTSSELFLYNPRLLFSMPDSMKDVPIKWEEVAP